MRDNDWDDSPTYDDAPRRNVDRSGGGCDTCMGSLGHRAGCPESMAQAEEREAWEQRHGY